MKMFNIEEYGAVGEDNRVWLSCREREIINTLDIGAMAHKVEFKQGNMYSFHDVTRLPDKEKCDA